VSEWEIEALDLDAYLRRIGHPGDTAPTAATLSELHRAHVAAIPFENVDILLGRGIDVALESIQAKLVRGGRGGYCYEHGLLFAAALERLGYGVERLLARVGGLELDPPRARTHMTLLVHVDGERWLADVGFGSGLLRPLPFAADGPQRQGGWTFRLDALGPHAWELRERRAGEWATLYGFDDQRQHFADVVMSNHFTSTFPRSPFVNKPVLVRKDEQRLRELIAGNLTVTRPDGSVGERPVDDLGATLRDVFRLSLTDEEIALVRQVDAQPHDRE
jgi:N-hydroxyarylamine O-acetyltransferase